jgi:hypothetical protein
VAGTRAKIGLFAYQEGTSLLIHSIFQGGFTSPASHRKIHGDLGIALLFTAVAAGRGAQNDAACLLQASAIQFPLSDGVLFLPDHMPLHIDAWRAAIFFDSGRHEDSLAAGRLVTVEWPRIVQYHLRLDHLYINEYRSRVASQQAQLDSDLRDTLGASFSGQRKLKPSHLISSISRAQYALLNTLGEADRLTREARRELDNLSTASLSMTSASASAITGRGHLFVAQMAADVAAMQSSVERADRAIAALRAQADIQIADNTRRLMWIAAVIGVVAAVPPLVGDDLASSIYTAVGGASLGHLPPGVESLIVRIILSALLTALIWLAIRLIRLGHR